MRNRWELGVAKFTVETFSDDDDNAVVVVTLFGEIYPYAVLPRRDGTAAVVSAWAWSGAPAVEARELDPEENPYAYVVAEYETVSAADYALAAAAAEDAGAQFARVVGRAIAHGLDVTRRGMSAAQTELNAALAAYPED